MNNDNLYCTFWWSNIAMENDPFLDGCPFPEGHITCSKNTQFIFQDIRVTDSYSIISKLQMDIPFIFQSYPINVLIIPPRNQWWDIMVNYRYHQIGTIKIVDGYLMKNHVVTADMEIKDSVDWFKGKSWSETIDFPIEIMRLSWKEILQPIYWKMCCPQCPYLRWGASSLGGLILGDIYWASSDVNHSCHMIQLCWLPSISEIIYVVFVCIDPYVCNVMYRNVMLCYVMFGM